MSKTDKRKKKQHSIGKKKPPRWLNKEEREYWRMLPKWNTSFENEKKHLTKMLLLHFCLTDGIIMVASLILAAGLIWRINLDMLPGSPILISIANITCATAAGVTAIILAFVMFRYGHAKRLEEESRSNIPAEIQRLKEIRAHLSDFASASVRETAGQYKEKAQNLIDAAKKFDTAIFELARRFAFAEKRGTYCDHHFLRLLEDHIFKRAGDWFVAHLEFWESFKFETANRELARSIQNSALGAAKNLYRLNENIKDSDDELRQALDLSISLPSFLLIVFIGLLSISAANRMAPLLTTWITIILIALLITHLIFLIWGIMKSMLRENTIRTANCQYYLEEVKRNTQVNYNEMLNDSLELLKVHPDLTEEIQKVEDQLSSETM